jgi:UPF0176 protein
MKPIKILLYYKYVPVENPAKVCADQKELCKRLNLKGRILISEEGINGTIAGLTANIDEYIKETTSIPEFSDLEWKISYEDEQVFPKLRVVVRDELVTLGIKKSGKDVAISNKADYIQPHELRELYESQEEFIIIDARNNYEAKIGKFKNAVIPEIENFREFPEFVSKSLENYKQKAIVTYCTGGVRCEKASAYLREQGFENVRQLHGGVHDYGEQAGGKYFEGKLFVFDKRLHVDVNSEDPKIISHCTFCQIPLVRLVDCVAFGCDGLFNCCENCQSDHQSACSPKCEQAINSTAQAPKQSVAL